MTKHNGHLTADSSNDVEYSDGRMGFAAPYHVGEDVRSSPWRATHLKSYRAGLFQRLRAEDLAWPEGAPVPWDFVEMMAAIEQAGWERTAFLAPILYVYAFQHSHEFRSGAAGQAQEIALAADIRARKPYVRIYEL